ncbi:heme exporter protein CcmD [Azospirillum halopraeferens]|uniref:heme exporter protein CcmD n=1 Tax=Azospirillum halopraeferens TaxID=34010 RepID=UPI0003FD8639|nr:heme exporter protein CcmD [Azospirillum halopraeferens]
MAEFFAMGGYAAYIWPSYALTALVMVGLLVATLKGLRSREATLKALEGSRPPRRRARREAAVHETAAEMGEG